MLLQRLAEYAANQDDQMPKLYQEMPIRWLIDLTAEGQFQGFAMTVGDGKKTDRGKRYVAPSVSRTVDIKANLLADNGEYVLGANRDPAGGASEKVQRRHKAFRDVIVQCAEATKAPCLQAVQAFLVSLEQAQCPLPEGFDAKDNLTIRVAGLLPFDLPDVRRFWGDSATTSVDAKKPAVNGAMRCIICSQIRPIVAVHPVKIKGIPDGQTSGMTLISANAEAFESY
ncbi:MAG: type I-C CRISPR-associated protein Cas8c/Csd1, partial [Candidatus Sericytochromatia bacterium]|nr:type I-C CRISPR-associated protein Cas8c/Csd1 [Candidatus Sericytochromatia bacterium]